MLPQSWRLEEDGAREEGCRDEPRVCLHEEPVRASPIHERRLLPANDTGGAALGTFANTGPGHIDTPYGALHERTLSAVDIVA